MVSIPCASFSTQYKFGARTGAAPVLLGCAKLLLGLAFGGSLAALLAAFPQPLLGALLAASGVELAAAVRHTRYGQKCAPGIHDCPLAGLCIWVGCEWLCEDQGSNQGGCSEAGIGVGRRPEGPGPPQGRAGRANAPMFLNPCGS